MNPDLYRLQPYPFEKLATLKQGVTPPAALRHLNLSIGEPQHGTPEFIMRAVQANLRGMSVYPTTKGGAPLREAIAAWLTRRFDLADAIDPERNVLPVNGTREALFAFAQCVVDRSRDALVLMPNPFYQIYEGAAYLAGAQPWFMNATAENGWLPDLAAVPEDVWRRCQLIYVCSPGNPTGAVMDATYLLELLRLADQYDFIIAADECYSEIYPDEAAAPPGLLQVAARAGRRDFARCVVFHSLSKRSNVPGLRSGFVAGDAAVLERFLLYRTYHGCAMPPPAQAASVAAWGDEDHVIENRALYRAKFDACVDILAPVLEVTRPHAGFYLWPRTPVSDTEFVRGLYATQHVTVLPGSFLSREAHGFNPGANHVRIALVPGLDDCVEAARRIRAYVENL